MYTIGSCSLAVKINSTKILSVRANNCTYLLFAPNLSVDGEKKQWGKRAYNHISRLLLLNGQINHTSLPRFSQLYYSPL